MNENARRWLVSTAWGCAAAMAMAAALSVKVAGTPTPLRLELGALDGHAGTKNTAPDHPAPPLPTSKAPKTAARPSAPPRAQEAALPAEPPAPTAPELRTADPTEDGPPAPPPTPDASRYGFPIEETSGGDVSLFAILVDHTGQVLDVQLPVPSRHLLKDVAMAMALYTQPIKLTPPLSEGKTIWLPMKFEYRPASEDTLP